MKRHKEITTLRLYFSYAATKQGMSGFIRSWEKEEGIFLYEFHREAG